MSQPLLIVGASVRAAAQSAARAGFAPLCIDLFADVDLQRQAPTKGARPFPAAIPEVAELFPPAPFMVTGAMENHLEIVERLSSKGAFYGSPLEVISRVRDPIAVAGLFEANGVPVAAVRAAATDLPSDGTWLRKPRLGSAGVGITPWTGVARPNEKRPPEEFDGAYFQARLEGPSYSAVFVAARGRAKLLGTTRQLVGTAWLHAAPFSYAGSIGPVLLDPESEDAWSRIGELLAGRFGLVGLFGVDAILSGGAVHPVEVNPRYTASVEILERAYSVPVIRSHVDAICLDRLPEDSRSEPSGCFGKAILFARQACTIPGSFVEHADEQNAGSSWPTIADIPQSGSTIPQGMPVTTVLTSGSDEREVLDGLRRLAAQVQKWVEEV